MAREQRDNESHALFLANLTRLCDKGFSGSVAEKEEIVLNRFCNHLSPSGARDRLSAAGCRTLREAIEVVETFERYEENERRKRKLQDSDSTPRQQKQQIQHSKQQQQRSQQYQQPPPTQQQA
jgi:hypothetical protein